MPLDEVEAILGPGKVCTFDDVLKIVQEAADPGGKRPVPAGLDDGSTWRLWQNGGLSVMVSFRKGNSGVERVATVTRLTRLPGGAIETRNLTGRHADLDAVAAERLKNQQVLKDPRWKTGPAVRAALVGKWRSLKGLGFRQGWDFNADGTCIFYRGSFDPLGGGQFEVERRGKYRFLDDAHVEMVTSSPYPGLPGQPPDQVTQRYQVLVEGQSWSFPTLNRAYLRETIHHRDTSTSHPAVELCYRCGAAELPAGGRGPPHHPHILLPPGRSAITMEVRGGYCRSTRNYPPGPRPGTPAGSPAFNLDWIVESA
jgi:hypothetical protein